MYSVHRWESAQCLGVRGSLDNVQPIAEGSNKNSEESEDEASRPRREFMAGLDMKHKTTVELDTKTVEPETLKRDKGMHYLQKASWTSVKVCSCGKVEKVTSTERDPHNRGT